MNLLKTLVFGAFLSLTSLVWAAPTPPGYDLGTLGDGDQVGFTNQDILPGAFLDSWTFSLEEISDVSVGFASVELPVLFWSIDGLTGTIDGGSDLGAGFTLENMTAGVHTLDISGTVPEGYTGYYSGGVGVRAVPIPAALWMFGSALLGLAGVVRARNRHSAG